MNAPAEKLAADVKILAADIEELIKATAAQSGEQLVAARARVQAALRDTGDNIVLRGRSTAYATDRYVRENPWPSIGVAATLGLVVGVLISNR